mgnify:CR=1 FL=1
MTTDAGLAPLKRALISVSDKTGIVDFTRALIEHGVEILSTGGTCRLLREAGLAVTEVSDHTGFPEMMDGRVKTLHPKIHGGILGRRGVDDGVMTAHDIPAIDLVVVNLYPFEATVARADCTLADAVENIDIGGPTMVRAAAKNHRDVAILVATQDYAAILEELTEHSGHTTLKTRFNLAIRAYEHIAAYDGMIANHFGCLVEGGSADYPRTFSLQLEKVQEMRYGENPHQSAAFYREAVPKEVGISSAKQLQGKALSYNNVADTDAALECVKSFSEPACVIVKHANPCGVAVADTLTNAYDLAFHTDSESAFGGIIAFNRELDADTASAIVERQFVEVIIAPDADADALEVVSSKANVRVLLTGKWDVDAPLAAMDYKRVNGGLLVQDRDLALVTREQIKVVSARQPSEQELTDMMFAWRVAKYVKSNAIVFCKDKMTIGVGAGQMSRVYSTRIAAIKAADVELQVKGSVMASDAFFPFRDGIDAAAEHGITAVIQPGGSMRDEEVIQAANEHDLAMVFTGMRHFRH